MEYQDKRKNKMNNLPTHAVDDIVLNVDDPWITRHCQ